MFESLKRQRRHRKVTMGIAAAAAVAGGAIIASQAMASPVAGAIAVPSSANIMVKVNPGAKCAYVADYSPQGQLRAEKSLDYTNGQYRSTDWNSTGIVGQAGDPVYVKVSYSPCVNVLGAAGGGQLPYTPYHVTRQGWGDYWIDASH